MHVIRIDEEVKQGAPDPGRIRSGEAVSDSSSFQSDIKRVENFPDSVSN